MLRWGIRYKSCTVFLPQILNSFFYIIPNDFWPFSVLVRAHIACALVLAKLSDFAGSDDGLTLIDIWWDWKKKMREGLFSKEGEKGSRKRRDIVYVRLYIYDFPICQRTCNIVILSWLLVFIPLLDTQGHGLCFI